MIECLSPAGCAWLAALFAAGAGCSRPKPPPPAARPAGAELIVAEEHADKVAFLRPDTLETLAEVPTGPNPHFIAVDAQRKRAFVSNYDATGSTPGVTVLDLASRKATGELRLPRCSKPHGLAIDAAGNLWVTCEKHDAVLVVDPSVGTVVRREPLDAKRTHMLLAIDGGNAVLASHLGAPWISVFSRERPGVARTVPLPHPAEGKSVAADGTLWVTSPATGEVTAVDFAKGTVLGTVRVGDGPVHVLATPEFVAVHVGADAVVVLLDPKTRAEIGRLALDAMGGDVVRASGSELLITDSMKGRVMRADRRTGKIVAERTLAGGANHLALTTPAPP